MVKPVEQVTLIIRDSGSLVSGNDDSSSNTFLSTVQSLAAFNPWAIQCIFRGLDYGTHPPRSVFSL